MEIYSTAGWLLMKTQRLYLIKSSEEICQWLIKRVPFPVYLLDTERSSISRVFPPAIHFPEHPVWTRRGQNR